MFIAFSAMFLFKLGPTPPPPPPDSAPGMFMGAFVPTGYLTLVKICELVGGALPPFVRAEKAHAGGSFPLISRPREPARRLFRFFR